MKKAPSCEGPAVRVRTFEPEHPPTRRSLWAQAVRIHQLALPLVGLEFLETLADQLGKPLPRQAAVHRAICISCEETHTVFDFLPRNPTAPRTALAMLSGKPVGGVTRERLLTRLPNRNCTDLGQASVSCNEALRKAQTFSQMYDLGLVLGKNDCRTFCELLAAQLLDTDKESEGRL